jgi:hypothetical protein
MRKYSMVCTVAKNLCGKYSTPVENYKELYRMDKIQSGFIRAYLQTVFEN